MHPLSRRQRPSRFKAKHIIALREPGENGKLIVTDEAGNRPPTEEHEIVAQQMDMVGRPNPFAQFLAGRTIAVGEKLELPKDLAAQIFNLGDKFGEVTRFTLTLQKVQPEGGANCAVFLASVEAVSNDASQMRLQVEGPLVVQVDSCRAVRIGLVGPIGMSETRGSYSTAYQVIGTGRLQMSIASTLSRSKVARRSVPANAIARIAAYPTRLRQFSVCLPPQTLAPPVRRNERDTGPRCGFQ